MQRIAVTRMINMLDANLHGSWPCGLDHGVGHPLLLLCDAKAYLGYKSNYIKWLGHSLFNDSIGLLDIIIK